MLGREQEDGRDQRYDQGYSLGQGESRRMVKVRAIVFALEYKLGDDRGQCQGYCLG